MERNCPKCGAALPEESSFCLNCFTTVNEQISDFPVVPPSKNHKLISKALPKKAAVRIVAACSLVLIFALICTIVISSKTDSVPDKVNGNGYSANEIFDDENEQNNSSGDTNTEEVETKKASFFDKLFGKDENKTDKEISEAEPTEKQGFFDRLFSSENKSSSDGNGISGTTNKASQSTTAPTVSTTCAATQTTKKPETTAPSVSNDTDFEYTVSGNYIKITKYKGNASVVYVPEKINGITVNELGKNTFESNSSIREIIFNTDSGTRFILPDNEPVFNNLPNLTRIVLPYNLVIEYFYFPKHFVSVPKLSSVEFASGSGSRDYMSSNGVVYDAAGKKLFYYPPGKTDENYRTLDSFINMVSDAVTGNPYLKTFTFGANAGNVAHPNFTDCPNIYAFISIASSDKFYTSDGVLVQKNVKISNWYYTNEKFTTIIYPAAKTDTYYETPAGCKISVSSDTFGKNPYLREINFKDEVKLESSMFYNLPNLQKVRIKDSEMNRSNYIPSNINATVEFY